VKVVWDDHKRLANLEKHGLDFIDVDDFGWADAFIIPTRGRRFKAIGLFRDLVIVVIYAQLGSEAMSIIGMRRAGIKERRLYESQG
jgi:uncharacterized DUF497 family protein